MREFFYGRGVKTALHDLGLGEELYTAANRESGRLGVRTLQDPEAQVSSAFSEHDRQLDSSTADSSSATPAGSYQSKTGVFDPLNKRKKSKPKKWNELIRQFGVAKLAEVNQQALRGASPVPIKQHEVAKRTGGGFFDNRGVMNPEGTPFIGVEDEDKLDDKLSLLAHEIGHAQFQEHPVGKFVQHPISRGAAAFGPLASFIVGRAPLKPKHKALGVGAAALGLSAPTLTGEAVASYKGYKLLKELGATDEQLRNYAKDIAGPQASYLMLPAMGAAFGYGGHRLSKLASFKLDRRQKFRGLDISIENDTGSTREWYDPNEDKKGQTTMRYPYGYIRMTEGLDGDHVDCFIGPNEEAENVYVITTAKPPAFTAMDEEKCMLGFDSEMQARAAFKMHYDDPRFLRSMKTLPFSEFKEKVLATRHKANKKVASNFNEYDLQHLISSGLGSSQDSVPGDNLGLPLTQLKMKRIVGGNPENPVDTIDRQFRFMDRDMDTDAIEGNSASLPSSPAV